MRLVIKFSFPSFICNERDFTVRCPSSLSSIRPIRFISVRIAPGGTSPPKRLTNSENELSPSEKISAAGFPDLSKKSLSECQRVNTSVIGVVRTVGASSPFSILDRRRRTSLRVRPVITATRDIFVGRPRIPKSELPTSTNASLTVSANSLYPIPYRNKILTIGRSTSWNPLSIFFCNSSCMGRQYIDRLVDSPEKCRTWEKTPKSCHKERHASISVI